MSSVVFLRSTRIKDYVTYEPMGSGKETSKVYDAFPYSVTVLDLNYQTRIYGGSALLTSNANKLHHNLILNEKLFKMS